MSHQPIESLSVRECLALFASLSDRLRVLGVCRSANNPVADYAEWLCSRALGLTLEVNSTTGFDARDQSNARYEIKARRQTSRSRPTHLSAIRGLPDQHFDYLVAVLFAEDFGVAKAVVLPFQAALRIARYRKHVNGSYIYLRDLWVAEEARDITEDVRGA